MLSVKIIRCGWLNSVWESDKYWPSHFTISWKKLALFLCYLVSFFLYHCFWLCNGFLPDKVLLGAFYWPVFILYLFTNKSDEHTTYAIVFSIKSCIRHHLIFVATLHSWWNIIKKFSHLLYFIYQYFKLGSHCDVISENKSSSLKMDFKNSYLMNKQSCCSEILTQHMYSSYVPHIKFSAESKHLDFWGYIPFKIY